MTRTVAPGGDKGLTRSVANLVLTRYIEDERIGYKKTFLCVAWTQNIVWAVLRWDPRRPPSVDNVVMLTSEEADQHDQVEYLEQIREEEPAFVTWVESIIDLARRQYFY